jgi:hypothetical protein
MSTSLSTAEGVTLLPPRFLAGSPGDAVYSLADGTLTNRTGTALAQTRVAGIAGSSSVFASPDITPVAPTVAFNFPAPFSNIVEGAAWSATVAGVPSDVSASGFNSAFALKATRTSPFFCNSTVLRIQSDNDSDGSTALKRALNGICALYRGSPTFLQGLGATGCQLTGFAAYTYSSASAIQWTGAALNGLVVPSNYTSVSLGSVASSAIFGGSAAGLSNSAAAAAISGTVGTVAGLTCRSLSNQVMTNFTVSDAIGLQVQATAVGPLVTRNSGIKIGSITGGTANYGLWLADNTNVVALGTAADASFSRGAASQLLTTGDWLVRHYLSSTAPTAAAGASAGTSPTISITGTDHGFAVTLTTGTTTTINGTLFTVTWGASYGATAPQVSFGEGNALAAALAVAARPFVSAVGLSSMLFTANGTVIPASTGPYVWRFTAMR